MAKNLTFKKGISVIINAKNEETRIFDCIKSISNWADEIIVVDMSSKDKTKKIAQKLGAQVYTIEDSGWVEPVRNWSFEKANFQWVFVLDADERVPETLKEKINAIIESDNYDVIKIPWKNIFFDKWIQHTLWWPDYHIRCFKKGYVKWEIKIHPEVIFKGRLLELEPLESLAVIHYNAENIKVWMNKIDAYTSREDFFKKRKSLNFEDVVNRYEEEFVGRYFNAKGYLDGVHGFVLSKFMEYYRFLEFVKYWETTSYSDLFSSDQIKRVLSSKTSVSQAQINSLKKENLKLNNDLSKIMESKTYRIWQAYCKFKKKVLGKIK
jgi:(heptosyl)LPS beta-1,4-glucosyltransferase